VVVEPENRGQRPRPDAGVVADAVGEQVRDAREEVFRAYVRAQDKAHELAAEDGVDEDPTAG
jgi:hypothetical protein